MYSARRAIRGLVRRARGRARTKKNENENERKRTCKTGEEVSEGEARRGEARQGKAKQGEAKQGKARQGKGKNKAKARSDNALSSRERERESEGEGGRGGSPGQPIGGSYLGRVRTVSVRACVCANERCEHHVHVLAHLLGGFTKRMEAGEEGRASSRHDMP